MAPFFSVFFLVLIVFLTNSKEALDFIGFLKYILPNMAGNSIIEFDSNFTIRNARIAWSAFAMVSMVAVAMVD